MRIKIHQEYFNTILFRDLIERHDIKHPKAIIDLAQFLINNVASRHSIKSLYRYLKSLQHSVSPETIAQYLDWFENTYFIFSLYLYDVSLKRSKLNDKKIYCIDHAFVTSLASGVLVNAGHLLESMIYISLRTTTEKIFYYRTRTGKEVDFVITANSKDRKLIQVCDSCADPKTMQRELNALKEAMIELHLNTGIIVTKTEENTITLEGLTIYIIPVWKFLLTMDIQKNNT